MTTFPPARSLSRGGFSLLELLVSTAIMALVLVAVLSFLNMTSTSYRRAMDRLDSFESARVAFDTLSRTLRQATLLSHVGYNDPRNPTSYQLKSDLHFMSGPQSGLGLVHDPPGSHAVFFQAPLGIADSADLQKANALLTSTGFFLAYGEDPLQPDLPGNRIENKHRYRLYQFLESREKMTVYEHTIATPGGIPVSDASYSDEDWFAEAVNAGIGIHPLAENVIALVILPIYRGSSWASYAWNSREPATMHRLPDALHVLLVAIDEQSAQRLGNETTAPALIPSSLFNTAGSFDDDVEALERALGEHTPALNYRIFKTVVPLASSDVSL